MNYVLCHQGKDGRDGRDGKPGAKVGHLTNVDFEVIHMVLTLCRHKICSWKVTIFLGFGLLMLNGKYVKKNKKQLHFCSRARKENQVP